MNGTDQQDHVQVQKPKVRSRIRRDTGELPPLAVTKRDLEILEAVASYQLLSARHIQFLFFRSLHKTRKRLFKLWQHGLLERRFPPIRLGEGSAQALYTLGSKGARFLVSKAGLIGSARQMATRPAHFTGKASPLFFEHTLKRNEFRLALTLGCRETPTANLLFWRQDKSIKDVVTFLNGTGKSPPVLNKVPIFADGFFGLQDAERKVYFFVEIDRGTTDNKRILAKMKGYYHLWLQRRHIQRFGIDNFRVLVVTTSSTRMENLIQTTKRVKESNVGSGLFWFATFDRYSLTEPQSIFGKIWKRAYLGNGNEYSLLE